MSWSDAARAAALEVRRGKAKLKVASKMAPGGAFKVYAVRDNGFRTTVGEIKPVRRKGSSADDWIARSEVDETPSVSAGKHPTRVSAARAVMSAAAEKVEESLSAPSHPPLKKADSRPDSNWVEKSGGLPPEIDAVARALVAKRGWQIGRAIATSVNMMKKGCSTGTAFGGKATLKPETRAKMCSAVASWEAKKGKGKLKETAIAFSGADLDAIYEAAECWIGEDPEMAVFLAEAASGYLRPLGSVERLVEAARQPRMSRGTFTDRHRGGTKKTRSQDDLLGELKSAGHLGPGTCEKCGRPV